MGNVQISQELFMQLLRFHLVEDESCEKEIKQGLEKKLDRMVMRDLYGKFKTAPTEEERERARKEYLDRRDRMAFPWEGTSSQCPWLLPRNIPYGLRPEADESAVWLT